MNIEQNNCFCMF